MVMPNALEIDSLTVSYSSGSGTRKVILKDFCLNVKEGEILGLLGPNGAGKTTLIKAMVGLINIDRGDIRIFGKSPASLQARRRLGYMPETANYYWFMTPKEILRMFGGISGLDKNVLKERVTSTLELVGLSEQKDDLVKTFSKGMQERLNIAQALLHDPDILVLDEPFSGLDPLGRIDVRTILKKLKSENKTILISSHELSEAELICDTISIMREGVVLKHGQIGELLRERGENSLENYFVKIINGRT